MRHKRHGVLLPQVAYLGTSQAQAAGFPLSMEIHSATLPRRSWVKLSQIRTLSVERIGRRIARLAPEEVGQLIAGLNEIIGD